MGIMESLVMRGYDGKKNPQILPDRSFSKKNRPNLSQKKFPNPPHRTTGEALASNGLVRMASENRYGKLFFRCCI